MAEKFLFDLQQWPELGARYWIFVENFKIDETVTPSDITGIEIGPMELESSLIVYCRKYSKTPIEEISGEGLRILLGQNLHLEVIVPATLCLLERNPFESCDFEDGVLMRTLFLRVENNYWKKNPSHYQIALDVFRVASAKLSRIFFYV